MSEQSDEGCIHGDATVSAENSSERFSIGSLVRRIDDFNQEELLLTIESLEDENELLRQQIRYYERVWYRAMDLLQTAYSSVRRIWNGSNMLKRERAKAEQQWLAYWGVGQETQVWI